MIQHIFLQEMMKRALFPPFSLQGSPKTPGKRGEEKVSFFSGKLSSSWQPASDVPLLCFAGQREEDGFIPRQGKRFAKRWKVVARLVNVSPPRHRDHVATQWSPLEKEAGESAAEVEATQRWMTVITCLLLPLPTPPLLHSMPLLPPPLPPPPPCHVAACSLSTLLSLHGCVPPAKLPRSCPLPPTPPMSKRERDSPISPSSLLLFMCSERESVTFPFSTRPTDPWALPLTRGEGFRRGYSARRLSPNKLCCTSNCGSL